MFEPNLTVFIEGLSYVLELEFFFVFASILSESLETLEEGVYKVKLDFEEVVDCVFWISITL